MFKLNGKVLIVAGAKRASPPADTLMASSCMEKKVRDAGHAAGRLAPRSAPKSSGRPLALGYVKPPPLATATLSSKPEPCGFLPQNPNPARNLHETNVVLLENDDGDRGWCHGLGGGGWMMA